mgnify:CR=1 FL=1
MIVIGILKTALVINLVLAIFNLIPIPPLDGSRVLLYFLPYEMKAKMMRFETYGFILIFALAYLGILGKIITLFLTPILGLLL